MQVEAIVYLDNAATSYPKPAAVVTAVADFLDHACANPGRSGHRLSARAARVVYDCREAVARLIGAGDPRQLVFTANATAAINTALLGFLRAGDHVVTTSLEHNSVMRPLRRLREQRGIEVTVAPADCLGHLDPQAVHDALRPNTRLVAVTHASNVVGTITPLADIRAAIGDLPFLVDAAQTIAAVPIDVEAPRIDLLAFSGHKSLLGPQGIGCLYVRPGLAIEPLVVGGTGSDSESDVQPDLLPDLLESGTPNGVGIAGLGAAARFIADTGLPSIVRHKEKLLDALLDGLQQIDGVTVWGAAGRAADRAAGTGATSSAPGPSRVAIVSLSIAGISPSEAAYQLDRRYGIMTRSGLHCAPGAHRTLGTFPEGTLRISPGYFNTPAEIALAVDAIADLAKEAKPGADARPAMERPGRGPAARPTRGLASREDRSR
jgi:cysteine desulfurase/selenocysteine lyase